ncbi:MAG: NAD(+) diphosphatase [Rhodospirillales bacterium]|nr:NAD(+) diphosphatase [Rhodospirillales bacterium]
MMEGLFYAGCGLDRVSKRRREAQWITDRLHDHGSRVVPVWKERNLIRAGAEPVPVALAGVAASEVITRSDDVVILGVDGDGAAWIAADLSSWDEASVTAIERGAKLADLRRVSAVMLSSDAALLAYARGIVHWHRRHRFCGICGSPTRSSEGGHLRMCDNPECQAQHFPRTDPAVIMLVTRQGPGGDACLLGRQDRWPRGMVSTLAGFVEPGETLEEAVAREVLEEVGIRVTGVRYRGSQPWPFPSSLMLGFRAEAEEGAEIVADADELEYARWFTPTDIDRFPEMGLKLPRVDSIARRLVEEWLREMVV